MTNTAGDAALRKALADAYEQGAMDVHAEWLRAHEAGEGPPRGDPEFGEAARDHASAAMDPFNYIIATPPSVPAQQWLPIGTAPKDGTDLLLFSPDAAEPNVFIGFWVEFHDPISGHVESDWTDTWTSKEIDAYPTHWMPLPATPPAQDQKGEEGA